MGGLTVGRPEEVFSGSGRVGAVSRLPALAMAAGSSVAPMSASSRGSRMPEGGQGGAAFVRLRHRTVSSGSFLLFWVWFRLPH